MVGVNLRQYGICFQISDCFGVVPIWNVVCLSVIFAFYCLDVQDNVFLDRQAQVCEATAQYEHR